MILCFIHVSIVLCYVILKIWKNLNQLICWTFYFYFWNSFVFYRASVVLVLGASNRKMIVKMGGGYPKSIRKNSDGNTHTFRPLNIYNIHSHFNKNTCTSIEQIAFPYSDLSTCHPTMVRLTGIDLWTNLLLLLLHFICTFLFFIHIHRDLVNHIFRVSHI